MLLPTRKASKAHTASKALSLYVGAGISPAPQAKPSSGKRWLALMGTKPKGFAGPKTPATSSKKLEKRNPLRQAALLNRRVKAITGSTVPQLIKVLRKKLASTKATLSTAAARKRVAAGFVLADWSEDGLPMDPETMPTKGDRKAILRTLQVAFSGISTFRRAASASASTDTASEDLVVDLDDAPTSTTDLPAPTTPLGKVMLWAIWASQQAAAASTSPGLDRDFQVNVYGANQEEVIEEGEPHLSGPAMYADLRWRLLAAQFVNFCARNSETFAAAGPAPNAEVHASLASAATVTDLRRRVARVPPARLVAALASSPHRARYAWLGERAAEERAAARLLGAQAHRARARAGAKAARRLRAAAEEDRLDRLDVEALIFDSAVDVVPPSPVKKAAKKAGLAFVAAGAAVKKAAAAAKPASLLAKLKERKQLANETKATKQAASAAKPTSILARFNEVRSDAKARRAAAKAAAAMAAFVASLPTMDTVVPAKPSAAGFTAPAGSTAAEVAPRRGLAALRASLRRGGEAAKGRVHALAAALPGAKKNKACTKLASPAPTPLPSPAKLAALASPAAASHDDEDPAPSPSSPTFRIRAVRSLAF